MTDIEDISAAEAGLILGIINEIEEDEDDNEPELIPVYERAKLGKGDTRNISNPKNFPSRGQGHRFTDWVYAVINGTVNLEDDIDEYFEEIGGHASEYLSDTDFFEIMNRRR